MPDTYLRKLYIEKEALEEEERIYEENLDFTIEILNGVMELLKQEEEEERNESLS